MDEKAADILAKAAAPISPRCCRSFARLTSGPGQHRRLFVRAYAEETGAKLGIVAQPLRAALTGRSTSPGSSTC